MSEERKLLTPEEYNRLDPFTQGYATYMQAGWPGSRIPKKCPYTPGTREAGAWAEGAQAAVLDVQDSEDD